MKHVLIVMTVLAAAGNCFAGSTKLSEEYKNLRNKCIGIIRNEMRSDNFYVTAAAIDAAGISRHDDFAPEITLLLNNDKNEIRLEAAKALFRMGNLDGVSVVEEIVRTPIKINGDYKSPVTKMKFLAAENVKLEAANLLGDIGGANSLEILKEMKKNESGRMRDAISVAIAKLGDATETILFERALKDNDSFVRLTAVQSLAEIASRKTLSAVLYMLDDNDSHVRAEACRAIGNIGGIEAVDKIKKMLNDPIDTVRGSAVEALGKMGDESSISILKELLEDDNGSIRLIAARSLGMLGSPAGLDAVKDGIENRDSDVRERVVNALEVIEHKKSIDYLAGLVDDKEDKIRLKAAGILIKKINRFGN